jgi:DNA-binding PadR family transcriptional regulator
MSNPSAIGPFGLPDDSLAPSGSLWALPQRAAGEAEQEPEPVNSPSYAEAKGVKLEELLHRVRSQLGSSEVAPACDRSRTTGDFSPIEPASLEEAGLTEPFVEALVLKYLLSRGSSTGREASDQVKLSFKIIDEMMRRMKSDQLLIYRANAPMNDYVYELTDMGRERARRFSEHCTYFGAAPVSLREYIASVHAQSLTKQHPTLTDLERAFEDLLLNKRMLHRLGPAINSGRGLFLYGAPGNGKSSIAERLTRAFGQYIWIPRALGVDGEVIRLYDPSNHERITTQKGPGLIEHEPVDRRWIRIRRPTIIVGGELTMASLEVTLNTSTKICEAPLQLKSNCGALVIDDFGRQRISTDELLNRWIVPLEKRVDYLNLPNGKKIEVPFDQLIVFSTNLQPKDLVDDAFLRRIPYKIDVIDPTEGEFRELFKLMAPKLGFEYREAAIDYLIEHHYLTAKRPFRCCQPRDLLLQIRNYCLFLGEPISMTPEYFDFAVENYFAVM